MLPLTPFEIEQVGGADEGYPDLPPISLPPPPPTLPNDPPVIVNPKGMVH
jgi:hypothetical protein